MSHIRAFCRLNWVKVAINDTIQVPGDNLGNFVKLFIIKRLRFFVYVLWKCDRCEVTHRGLIFVSILYNLSTKVRTLNHTQVLLVTLGVTGIFVEHVGSSSLSLRFENRLP